MKTWHSRLPPEVWRIMEAAAGVAKVFVAASAGYRRPTPGVLGKCGTEVLCRPATCKLVMPITEFAISQNKGPVQSSLSARFGPDGGTVGRADHNTLVLANPGRHISRLQAEVVRSGDPFVVRNVGLTKPIILGEQTLPFSGIAQLGRGRCLQGAGQAGEGLD